MNALLSLNQRSFSPTRRRIQMLMSAQDAENKRELSIQP